MVDAFVTALGTALGTFITAVEDGIGTSIGDVLPYVLGVIGILAVYRIVRTLLNVWRSDGIGRGTGWQ
jgi:hypothetical protein